MQNGIIQISIAKPHNIVMTMTFIKNIVLKTNSFWWRLVQKRL